MLNERFEIIRELVAGSQGTTFLAKDHQQDIEVAVKKLAVEKIENWKCLELFERESKVLKNLNHTNIPAYIDSFHEDDEIGRHFYLVQSYVPGKNLEDRFNDGERWDEKRATKLIESLINILAYLHALSPPVLHRDIKPSNIIETDEGELFLIDFGSVQEKIQSAVGGSTVSGTAGYIPMEQLMGRSVPASDIYGLGATVVRLMSRKHPVDIELQKSAMAFQEFVTCSPKFTRILEKMIAPSVEDRIENTSALRERLLKTDPKRKKLVFRNETPSSSSSPHLVSRRHAAAEAKGLWTFIFWVIAIVCVAFTFVLLDSDPELVVEPTRTYADDSFEIYADDSFEDLAIKYCTDKPYSKLDVLSLGGLWEEDGHLGKNENSPEEIQTKLKEACILGFHKKYETLRESSGEENARRSVQRELAKKMEHLPMEKIQHDILTGK